MSLWDNIINNLPEVGGPTQKKLGFKEKLKWTLIILVLFFILGMVPLFGLGKNALEQFEFLSIILGAKFGSIISLGIGPIVTSSIVLQLLNGSGLIKFDLTTHEGKKRVQGVQKLLSIFFIIFEAAIYVFMGGLAPDPLLKGTFLYFNLELIIILQMVIGGILIMFMDDIVQKWGFGSGISLFIVAGVAQSIFIQAFSFMPAPNMEEMPIGAIPALIKALSIGDPTTAGLMLGKIIATLIIFGIAVYLQAMNVEIPLSFGRIRGHGIRWPLNFCYANVIPVILVTALMANIQLIARLIQQGVSHSTWLGGFSDSGQPISGLVTWFIGPNIVESLIKGSLSLGDIAHAIVYVILLMIGCVVFSVFWVQTSGMDPRSQAKQMMSSGLQIPGFRKDQRVLERLLERYINPLTVMGGLAIGFLAGAADISGTITNGTGLLLTVMIIYRMYEDIAKQHMMDMHPMMKKFMGG